MPERRDLLQPEGGTGHHRAVAASLQHPQTSLSAGLPATSTRYSQHEATHSRGRQNNAVNWNPLTCAGPKYRSGHHPRPRSARHLGGRTRASPSAVTRHPLCPALGRFGRRDASPLGLPRQSRVADSGVRSVQVRSPQRDNSMNSLEKTVKVSAKTAETERESSV